MKKWQMRRIRKEEKDVEYWKHSGGTSYKVMLHVLYNT